MEIVIIVLALLLLAVWLRLSWLKWQLNIACQVITQLTRERDEAIEVKRRRVGRTVEWPEIIE